VSDSEESRSREEHPVQAVLVGFAVGADTSSASVIQVECDYEEAARLASRVDWNGALPARANRWRWRAAQRLKRIVDFCVAGTGLVILSPVFLLVAAAVALDSPGPVFYPWRVLGYRGRRFTGYKFRSMVSNADSLKASLAHLNQMSGPVFKIRNDPRVTRVGRFLRRYSIDELPQLWSVVKGDMSLVGPRPPSPREYVDFLPAQRRKLAVVPGITCLWQVLGRSEINSFAEWASLDLEYIERWSLWLDLQILLRTVPAVLVGRGAY
jgi:lipopolysaccharide/colanic/teichoic acid biosynthesis glycosyltransferase